MLLLPGDPEFDWTLASSLPPSWRAAAAAIGEQVAFVAEAGSGLLRPATAEELNDYLYGGEYDDRLDEIGDGDELAADLQPNDRPIPDSEQWPLCAGDYSQLHRITDCD